MASYKNDSNAQFTLGLIYLNDKYVPQDINKSIHYLILASNRNHSKAQSILGYIYYKGLIITRDINKSIYYLSLSSKNLNPEAQFYLGQIYYDGKYIQRDIDKAIHYFKESSCFDNNKAKNNLGIIYKNGDGVEKNIFNAIQYFEEAINKKQDLYAMYNLLRIYYFGIDIDKNSEKSLELIKKLLYKHFDPSLLFLYYINLGNDEVSYYCSSQLRKEFDLELTLMFGLKQISYKIQTLKFHSSSYFSSFLKEYDLLYSDKYDYFHDFNAYMETGSFQDNKSNAKKINDINELFYEGFYHC
ncbi:hypothetical protein M9Y10_019785 [Tritrichomonas musculus]|uniref:HCP-like protein n=1 Tax=Tritrichomonas musculus TaxID=1915356 RepID=A0ABR2HI76_9EUKA